MNKMGKLIGYICLGLLVVLGGCNSSESCTNKAPKATVLTEAQQKSLTAQEVKNSLLEGNNRFVANDLTQRDHSAQVRKSTYAQFPKAIILSCVDSRIPVEDVFDRGIGDIFVARVAGNITNVDILGSMEFACKVSGAKLIFVLGHEHCGAVKSAISNVELGNITAMLNKIKPAIKMSNGFDGEKSASNQQYVDVVTKNNVIHSMGDIRENSPILREMEKNGEIDIIGGVYDMTTGKVILLDE